MIHDSSDLTRVLVAMLYSGVFWATTLYVLERRPAWRGAAGMTALILVLSVYLFMGVVVGGHGGD